MNSPEISISFCKLAIAQCVATFLAAVLWVGGGFLGGFEMQILLAGIAESGVLLVVSLGVLTLFNPSKLRPIATAATMWSVTSFVRFIVALLCSSLLYYVAQFGLRPLIFSFLLTAVFLLVAETKALSSMLLKIGSKTNE